MAGTIIKPKKIWDISRLEDRTSTRMELTDLIRFKEYWYCSFREGEIHNNHPSGRSRIIRSRDGEEWETAALFDWDGADVREVKLSITPENWLLANTSLYFTSPHPRFRDEAAQAQDRKESFTPLEVKNAKDRPGSFYQLDDPRVPATDKEELVIRQSVTWLSHDGVLWSSAYACESGVNFWRWEVQWHNGMGYSAGHRPNEAEGNGTLFRTRDGKSWRPLTADFYPAKNGNEAALAFDTDGTAYCLLRNARQRRISGPQFHSGGCPMMGIGQSPYYTQWEWKDLTVDLGEDGGLMSADEALLVDLGGPKLVRLKDGRFVGAARVLFPGATDGHITLFWLDTKTATLKRFADIDGTSYPGVIEHEGQLWVSCCDTAASAIYLAKVDLP